MKRENFNDLYHMAINLENDYVLEVLIYVDINNRWVLNIKSR